VLPFDWRALAGEFAETLARYQTQMGDAFDFSPVETALRELDVALERFSSALAQGKLAAGAANATHQGLARILVPLNFTREPRFRHDPAYTAPPLPALAIAAEFAHLAPDQRGFALTQLLRGRNVVAAALRQATRLVEAAVS
jgi:N-acetylated-alpha-linked acidic dipeptidase